MVAFQHAILHAIPSADGIHEVANFNASTVSPWESAHAFYCRRAAIIKGGLASCDVNYEINSLTSDRSSFNSATDASIFARLKSFIGTPCTISHCPPRTRTGNEEIKPCSTS